jgi:hypothetical protein
VNLGGAGVMQHDLIKILERRDVPTRDYHVEKPISSVYSIALSSWQSMPGIRQNEKLASVLAVPFPGDLDL